MKNLGRLIFRSVAIASNLGGYLAMAAIMGMVLLITANVFMRYVFNSPIRWSPEIVGYLMAGVVFLVLADTFRSGRHIRIEIFVKMLPEKAQHAVEVLVLALSSTFVCFFVRMAWKTVMRSHRYGSRDSWGILEVPLYIPQLVMLIGLILLALLLVSTLINKIYVLSK